MTRKQVVGLAAVVTLLVAAFVVQSVRAPSSDDELAALRSAAGLQPCPAGVGRELPPLTLACLGGGDEVDLRASGPGRPALVNAWAPWCGPCKREIPELVALADRAGDRLGVLGVLSQETPANGLDYARAAGMRYPSVVDDDGAFFRAYSGGPPVTVFVTADGAVAHVERGEVESLDELLALVRTHLGLVL